MTWHDEGSSNGPDEGGLRGENTPFLDKNSRAPSEEQVKIDAARGHPFDPGAGPDSSGLTDERHIVPDTHR